MHDDRPDFVAAERAAAIDNDLKLVLLMEVRQDHLIGVLLDQQRMRRRRTVAVRDDVFALPEAGAVRQNVVLAGLAGVFERGACEHRLLLRRSCCWTVSSRNHLHYSKHCGDRAPVGRRVVVDAASGLQSPNCSCMGGQTRRGGSGSGRSCVALRISLMAASYNPHAV